MPLVPYSLQIIKDVLVKLSTDANRVNKILCLATPDIVASRRTVTDILGTAAGEAPARPDSEQIINWHKAHKITTEILDTRAVFKALGYDLNAFDITEGRGNEEIIDLSDPLPPTQRWYEAYDLVFDCISNQVFNVAEAWRTMMRVCRPGGWILSVTPIQMVNQGFWNISPAAYRDFCDANALELEYQAITGVYTDMGRPKLDTFTRLRGVADDTMNVALMRKTRAWSAWPIMTKFKKYPDCRIDSIKGRP